MNIKVLNWDYTNSCVFGSRTKWIWK